MIPTSKQEQAANHGFQGITEPELRMLHASGTSGFFEKKKPLFRFVSASRAQRALDEMKAYYCELTQTYEKIIWDQNIEIEALKTGKLQTDKEAILEKQLEEILEELQLRRQKCDEYQLRIQLLYKKITHCQNRPLGKLPTTKTEALLPEKTAVQFLSEPDNMHFEATTGQHNIEKMLGKIMAKLDTFLV